MDKIIEFKDINVNYGNKDKPILENLCLSFSRYSFVSIVGPSGCGKSSFIKYISGINLNNSQKKNYVTKQKCAFVFQESNLLPWLSVQDNINLPLKLLKRQFYSHRELSQLFSKFNLNFNQLKASFPHQLSGGMKMRVSLIRALISEPELLLLDEPFSAIDEHQRLEFQKTLKDVYKESRLTVVLVTHSLQEALFLSEKIVFLRDGKCAYEYIPKQFSDIYSSEFQDQIKFLHLKWCELYG